MIFIVNESGKQISLKADVVDTNVVLSAKVEGNSLMLLYAGNNTECGNALLDQYGNGEDIRNSNLSRHNVKIDGAHILYAKNLGSDPSEKNTPTGYEESLEMLAVCKGEPLPKVYTTSKDIIVVIHNTDDVFWMEHKHLLFMDDPKKVVDEQSTIQATIFPIKWYNWSKLKSKTYIYKDNEGDTEKASKCYRLGYKNGKIENSTVNIIKPLSKESRK